MRFANAALIAGGRPSWAPCFRFSARASRVQLPDQPPLELGEGRHHVRHGLASRGTRIDGDIKATKAQPSFCAISMILAKSSMLRLRRSSFATTSVEASPRSNASSAARMPGR